MKLEKTIEKFLKLVEDDAKSSYSTWDGKKCIWNDDIWERAEPDYFFYVKRIREQLKERAQQTMKKAAMNRIERIRAELEENAFNPTYDDRMGKFLALPDVIAIIDSMDD